MCLCLKRWLPSYFIIGVLASHCKVWILWTWAEHDSTADIWPAQDRAVMPSGSVYNCSEINYTSPESTGVDCHSRKFHHPKIVIKVKSLLDYLTCCSTAPKVFSVLKESLLNRSIVHVKEENRDILIASAAWEDGKPSCRAEARRPLIYSLGLL